MSYKVARAFSIKICDDGSVVISNDLVKKLKEFTWEGIKETFKKEPYDELFAVLDEERSGLHLFGSAHEARQLKEKINRYYSDREDAEFRCLYGTLGDNFNSPR